MKNISKRNKWIAILTVTVFVIGSFSLMVSANYLEPGSEDDPIVTLSYIEKRLEQIKYYIDQSIGSNDLSSQVNDLSLKVEELSKKLEGGVPAQGVSADTQFKVVPVEKGKFVYFGESTEFILRAGEATAIQGRDGGLSDVTMGKDLKTGDVIPLNHLIIIPKNDGRGVSIQFDSYLMIKGAYTIQ